MDHSGLRLRAVVDFIEFEVTTAQPTNFHSIQRTLGPGSNGKPRYVEALDAGPGGAAVRFIWRLYDPKNWDEVQAKLDLISEAHPLAEAPRVTALETSLDAYSRANDPDELTRTAAGFFRYLKRPVAANRRFVGREGEPATSPGTKASTEAVFSRRTRTLYIGNQEFGTNRKTRAPWVADSLTQRIYVKVTDRQSPLPLADHRARIELTQRGAELGFHGLDEQARAFRFESLSPYFQWTKPAGPPEELTTWQRMFLAAADQVGARRSRNRRGGGTKQYSSSVCADIALNRLAYDALRDLTRRMRAKTRPRGCHKRHLGINLEEKHKQGLRILRGTNTAN